MPSCDPRRPRSTRRPRASTDSWMAHCCGRGISRRSARTCERTRRGGSSDLSSDPFTSLPAAVGSPPEHYGNPLGEQQRLAAGEAIVDLSDRAVLALTGEDRLTWLDSLTSQSIAKLAP